MSSIWNFLSNLCPYNNLINKSSKISIIITSQTNIEFMSVLSFCGDISHHYGKVTVTDGCSGGVEDESIKLPHE